jgi:hypothetical protein
LLRPSRSSSSRVPLMLSLLQPEASQPLGPFCSCISMLALRPF